MQTDDNPLPRPLEALYFFHIPKTAGTSIRYWLEELFDRDAWLPCYILDEVARETPELLQHRRFFSGHFGWKLFDYLGHHVPTVTWLRHPVRRLISQHDFNRNRYPELVAIAERNQQWGWIEFYNRCIDTSLPHLCGQEEFLGFSDNLQTRYLAGVFPHTERILIGDAELERAKHSLARMEFVGVCEWMAASIDALCQELQSPARPLQHHFNRTPSSIARGKTQLDPHEWQVVAETERYDMQLYEFAQELFRRRFLDLAKRAGCRGLSLDQLDELLAHYGDRPESHQVRVYLNHAFCASQNSATPGFDLQVDFANAVWMAGWYPRTHLPTGQTLRWAGPESSASVFLPMRPDVEYEFSFVARYVLSYEILKTLRIRIGEQEFPVSWTPHADNFGGKQQFRITARMKLESSGSDARWRELRIVTLAPLQPFQHDPAQLASFATDGVRLREIGAAAGRESNGADVRSTPCRDHFAA